MGQSIFLNAIIAAASRVIVVALGLYATALTVRIISVESFGTYSLLLTIGTFLQLFADFGLYLTASRELGAAQDKRESVMRHIISLRLALLGIFFTLGFIFFLFIPHMRSLISIFVLLLLGLVFQSMSQLMMGVFQAYGDIWKATVGDVLGRVAQVGILGYIFYNRWEKSLLWVAAAFMVSLFIAWVTHLVFIPRWVRFFPKISLPTWRYLVKTSWPIGLMLVLNVIYFRSDIIILPVFRPLTEVGWYGLAYKIIENGLFFPAMLGGLLLPHISSAISVKNTQRVKDIVSQGLVLSLYVGIIVITVLLVFAGPIITLIAGSGFDSSVPLLRVLSGALALMFLGNIFGFALIALSRQRTLVVLYGFLVLFNIASNILFIPMYGAHAAAWITVVTEAIAMFTGAYVVYGSIKYRIPIFPIVLAVFSALIASYVGSIFPSYIHISFRLVFVGALYAGLGYCFGLWNAKTISILRTTSSI